MQLPEAVRPLFQIFFWGAYWKLSKAPYICVPFRKKGRSFESPKRRKRKLAV